jgi:hypothetical protein
LFEHAIDTATDGGDAVRVGVVSPTSLGLACHEGCDENYREEDDDRRSGVVVIDQEGFHTGRYQVSNYYLKDDDSVYIPSVKILNKHK